MRILFFLTTVFITSSLLSQENKSVRCYKNGHYFLGQKRYPEAAACFKKYCTLYPDSQFYFNALISYGQCMLKTHKTDSALFYWKFILNVPSKNGPEAIDDRNILLAYGKHKSCGLICELWKKRKNYDSALHYLILWDSGYPNMNSCGNALYAHVFDLTDRYSELFELKGLYEKALCKVLPLSLSGYFDYSDEALRLAAKTKNKELLFQKFEDAIQNIMLDSAVTRNHKIVYEYYYILFLGERIVIPTNDEINGECYSAEKTRAYLRQSEFYRGIKKMAGLR